MQLSAINRSLRDSWGFDLAIDAEGARNLKFVADRERFIEAVEQGPACAEADRYVRSALQAAGYPVHAGETGDAGDRPTGAAAPGAGYGEGDGEVDQGSRGTAPPGPGPATPPLMSGDAASPPQGARQSIHVYGKKAAVTVEADTTRRGRATVAIDGAVAKGGGHFDWGSKVRVQLTPNELVELTAVLLGALDECRFDNRGDHGEKGLSLERQGQGSQARFFLRVFARGASPCAVPISAPDALWIVGLCTSQLRASFPWMDQPNIEGLIRSVYCPRSTPAQ